MSSSNKKSDFSLCRSVEQFVKKLNNFIFKCKCGIKRNLLWPDMQTLPHKYKRVIQFEENVARDKRETQINIENYFVNKTHSLMSSWFSINFMALLPCSFLKKSHLRKATRSKPSSLATFIKNFSKLTKVVKRELSDLLFDNFAPYLYGFPCNRRTF